MSFRGRGLPDGSTRLLGIVGRPLAHSLSPTLQTAVLRTLDRNLIYVPLPVSEERLPALLRDAPELGIAGLNVTTPFKETVARLVRPLDEETVRTGTVNTVLFPPDGAAGCGTDGAGILRYLKASGYGEAPYGVLGFGATARSLIHRGVQEGRSPAVVITRRDELARGAVRAWGGGEICVSGWAAYAGDRTTRPQSAGALSEPGAGMHWPRVWISTLGPEVPPLPAGFWERAVGGGALVDLNYGEGRTVRQEEARRHGWLASDGLGPLCHQASLSLGLWIGEDVPVALFVRALGRSERSLRPGR